MLQKLFEPFSPMETERLLLRCVRMSDDRDLFEVCQDPQVARYVLWDAHHSIYQTRDYIRCLQKQYRGNEAPTVAIVWKADHKAVGTISFLWIDEDNQSAEVGYSLNRSYWGRGIATEALKAILRYGFEIRHLNRMEAQHDVRNPASGRVMEKAGMTKEGILRQRVRNKNEWVDVALYSILRKEFSK